MSARSAAVLAMVFACASAAFGQAVTTADLLDSAVDPYLPGAERARFLYAAGADNELNAQEFAADAAKPKPFVRKFDSWAALVKFDKDHNATVDWFEADAYRRALAARIVAEFDKNKDGRLMGEERTAANLALAAGKVPAVAPTTQPARSPAAVLPLPSGPDADPFGLAGTGAGATGAGAGAGGGAGIRTRIADMRDRVMKEYDKDGDGQLSDAEREAMREAFRQRMTEQRDRWMVRQYDKNGDGKLDDTERAAADKARAEARAQWEQRRAAFIKEHDTDGDGTLSEEERRAMAEKLREQVRAQVRTWTQPWDTDADGKLSDTERQAMQGAIRAEIDRHRKAMDADGDGQVSREEATGYWQSLQKQYDTDKDGQLSAEERQAMFNAIRNSMTKGAAQPTEGK